MSNLANNWKIGGRTRHVDVQMFFLQELKEDRMVEVIHIPGPETTTDMFTKTVHAVLLHRHSVNLGGKDKLLVKLKGRKP